MAACCSHVGFELFVELLLVFVATLFDELGVAQLLKVDVVFPEVVAFREGLIASHFEQDADVGGLFAVKLLRDLLQQLDLLRSQFGIIFEGSDERDIAIVLNRCGALEQLVLCITNFRFWLFSERLELILLKVGH